MPGPFYNINQTIDKLDNPKPAVVSDFGHGTLPYLSFSGVDIKAVVSVRPFMHEAYLNSRPVTKVLADLQTISISSFRGKSAVRTLGRVSPVAFTRGNRTIAGSMIFTLFNKDVFYDIMQHQPGDAPDISNGTENPLRYTTVDQIPPFDIVFLFSNEYGYASKQIMYGCEITQTGQVMSIEDLFTEKTAQYIALEMTPLIPINSSSGRDEISSVDVTKVYPLTNFDNILSTSPEARQILSKTRNSFR